MGRPPFRVAWTMGQVMLVSPKKAVKTESDGDAYAIPLLNRKHNRTGAASSTNQLRAHVTDSRESYSSAASQQRLLWLHTDA